MPSHSLLSLLPTTSITPRNTPSNHLHLLRFHKTLRPQPLHASPSPSPAAGDELHLLDKPSPSAAAAEAPSPPPSRDEALAPFLKFFQVKSTETGADDTGGCAEGAARAAESAGAARGRFGFRCYDPRPGDLVVGVVVGGDERTVDVDVGAGGEPALILAKEAVPLCAEEFGYLSCDVASEEAGRFAVEGKVGVVVRSVVQKGEVVGGRKGKRKGAPVVGVGSVVFAEVLGRTLGGRLLLSARRLFRRVAWLRVRQIKQLNIPIEVKIFEWNAGGLLSRIEGLRAFLPKPEMMTRPRNFTDLKNNVGRQIHVCITRVDEGANELIVSEKEAWEMTYLKEGSLLQGTVRKLFPYGAQIRIGETNRSGLLHISNISHGRVASISDVLKVDEEVKVLVIKSTVPDRIALSIKDLESEPGLFLSNKDKVFSEAEEMAQKYREQIPETSGSDELDSSCSDALPFDSEAESYANWKWLKFKKSDKVNCNSEPRLQHRISE